MASAKTIRTRALRLLEQARDASSGFLRQNLVAQAQIAQLDPDRYRTTVQELRGIALSLLGRDGHRKIAHVTPNEIVVPKALQTPEFMAALAQVAQQAGLDPREFQVGSLQAKVNPRTGQEEFNDGVGARDYFGAIRDGYREGQKKGFGVPLGDLAKNAWTGIRDGFAGSVGFLSRGDNLARRGVHVEYEPTAAMPDFGGFPMAPPMTTEQAKDALFSQSPPYQPKTAVGKDFQNKIADGTETMIYKRFAPGPLQHTVGPMRWLSKRFEDHDDQEK